MLLDELSLEEKKAFWNIANVLAAVDGRTASEESILNQYKEEMGVDFELIDSADIDIKNELAKLGASSIRNRKIVYFELFSVAYADTEFDEKEKGILDEAYAVLGISSNDREFLESSVKTIFDTYKTLGDVLNT